MAANQREDAAASSSMNPAAAVQREDVPRSLTLQCCFLSLDTLCYENSSGDIRRISKLHQVMTKSNGFNVFLIVSICVLGV